MKLFRSCNVSESLKLWLSAAANEKVLSEQKHKFSNKNAGDKSMLSIYVASASASAAVQLRRMKNEGKMPFL